MSNSQLAKPSYINRRITKFKPLMGPFGALVALCLIVGLNSPNFFSLGNFTNILQQVSVYGLISISLTYVLLIGNVDLSVGSTVAFAGCLCVVLVEKYQLPAWVAILITILVSSFVGLFNGIFLAYTTLPPFIVTLSTQMSVRGIAYIFTGGYPVVSKNQGFNNIGVGRFKIIIGSFKMELPYSVIILLVAFIVFGIILSQTKFGRYMYAVGGNREAARHSGINDRMVKIVVYIISACLAAIAGIILAARLGSGQPTVGLGYEGEAIASSVLGGVSFGGGVGTIGATVIGTFIMGIINNGLNMLRFEYFYQLIVKGMIILFAVYIDSIRHKFSLSSIMRRRQKIQDVSD